jgi:Dihydrodipicolinate synthase/N-acetylneuraminate lyase
MKSRGPPIFCVPSQFKMTIFTLCVQVLVGAFALGCDSAIATSLNMLPSPSFKILAAMRSNLPSEALQEQKKLSDVIRVITRNGKCLRK